MLGNIELTNRGFQKIIFKDSYNVNCSLQESSSVIPRIWLGVHELRMNLDIEKTEELIKHLQNWVDKQTF